MSQIPPPIKASPIKSVSHSTVSLSNTEPDRLIAELQSHRPGLPSRDRLLPSWGAPRIHGELLKLGIDIGQTSVAKYMARRRRPPSQGWRTFLLNDTGGIGSIDLFVVPTISFKLLYGLLILRHDRRRILWVGVTPSPTADWVARQVSEACGWEPVPDYLVRDRDRAKELVAEASTGLQTLSAEDALKLMGDPNVIFVDVREQEELQRNGKVRGAIHVPRGLLEFQVDPTSPTHKPELGGEKKLVLYCGSGGRSALGAKTLNQMGINNVAHVAGGFPALQEAGAPREEIR